MSTRESGILTGFVGGALFFGTFFGNWGAFVGGIFGAWLGYKTHEKD